MLSSRSHQLRCVRSNVALSAEVAGSNAHTASFTSLLNLSGTGCLIETDRALEVGEVVFMRFSLPGQAEVNTQGRVARVEADKIGVSFQELNEGSSERIVRHVLQHGSRARG